MGAECHCELSLGSKKVAWQGADTQAATALLGLCPRNPLSGWKLAMAGSGPAASLTVPPPRLSLGVAGSLAPVSLSENVNIGKMAFKTVSWCTPVIPELWRLGRGITQSYYQSPFKTTQQPKRIKNQKYFEILNIFWSIFIVR